MSEVNFYYNFILKCSWFSLYSVQVFCLLIAVTYIHFLFTPSEFTFFRWPRFKTQPDHGEIVLDTVVQKNIFSGFYHFLYHLFHQFHCSYAISGTLNNPRSLLIIINISVSFTKVVVCSYFFLSHFHHI